MGYKGIMPEILCPFLSVGLSTIGKSLIVYKYCLIIVSLFKSNRLVVSRANWGERKMENNLIFFDP